MALRLTYWIIASVACVVLAVATVSETLACSSIARPAGTPTIATIELLLARQWQVAFTFGVDGGTAERTLWLVPWVAMACLTGLYLSLAWLLDRAVMRRNQSA